jgi:hypothetical protein
VGVLYFPTKNFDQVFAEKTAGLLLISDSFQIIGLFDV